MREISTAPTPTACLWVAVGLEHRLQPVHLGHHSLHPGVMHVPAAARIVGAQGRRGKGGRGSEWVLQDVTGSDQEHVGQKVKRLHLLIRKLGRCGKAKRAT